jgi:hypothetical protein
MIPIDPNNDGTKKFNEYLRTVEPNPKVLWPDRFPTTVHSLVLNEKELINRLKAVEAKVDDIPFPIRGSM